MKKLGILTLLLVTCSLFASIKHISTKDLEKLVTSNSSLVIVDARTPEYFKGEVIQGAKWLPYDSSEEKIKEVLPSKTATIVVYCLSSTCPASGRLADRLKNLGYTDISEYTDGISAWKSAGLPVRAY